MWNLHIVWELKSPDELTKCEASGNAKAVALITRTSPAAWRRILLNGHHTFQSGGNIIDLDALLAGLELE